MYHIVKPGAVWAMCGVVLQVFFSIRCNKNVKHHLEYPHEEKKFSTSDGPRNLDSGC